MKRSALFLLLPALVLLGQGCFWNNKSVSPSSADSSQNESQSPTPNPSPAVSIPSNLSFPGVLPEEQTKKHVRISTTKGDIVIELLPDQGPNAASNFVYLVNQKFYDGISFHRRDEGFVIQGGDPLGNGTGGPGYRFADDPVKPVGENPQLKELPEAFKASLPPGHPLLTKGALYARGTLAMANAGPDTNGSQFFIMLADAPLTLDYSVFGRVIEGMDVVDAIQIGDTMTSVTIEE